MMRRRSAVLLVGSSLLCLFVLRVKYSDSVKVSPRGGVFGLGEACAPLDSGGQDVVTSPGDLIISEAGKLSGIRLIVKDATVNGVAEQWYLVSGAGAGAGMLANFQEEVAREDDPLVAIPLGKLSTEAPGVWALALTVSRAQPFRIELAGVEYDLDGQTYRIEDDFVFEQPCPDE